MGSFALLCTIGGPDTLQGDARRHLRRAARRRPASPFPPFQRDLPIMPELAPVLSERGVDVYDVDIREGLAEILPGFQTPIYGYDGIYPGPTIRARKGRAAIVRQHNRLSFDSNVHLHGGYVPGGARRPPDGRHRAGRRRSTTRTRTSRTRRSSGTTTTRTGARRGRSTTASSAPTCSTTSARRSSSCPGASTTCRSSSPTTRSTRTARSATRRTSTSASAATRSSSTARSRRGCAVERRIYRLRFLNASNARSYELRLGNGRAVVADRERRRPARAAGHAPDGRRCTRPSGSSSWSTSATSAPGTEIVLHNLRRRGDAPQAVMRFDVVRGGGARRRAIPSGRMRTLERLPEPNATPPLGPDAATHGPACSGRSPAAGSTRAGSTSGRGSARTELWQWHNPSKRVHPMHLHGMLFRIVERSSGVVHPGERGWKDTIGVQPGETVDGAAVVRALRGPLRVPLPRARARRQGDDAPAGGGPSEAPASRCALGTGARRSPRPRPPRAAEVAGQGPRHARVGQARRRRSTLGDTVALDVRRHDGGAQRRSRPSANWIVPPSPIGVAGAAGVSTVHAQPGTYAFVCQVHPDTMIAATVVDRRATPPPPPPPLSEQPFANDSARAGACSRPAD